MTPIDQFNSAAPVAWPSGRPRTQQRVYRPIETRNQNAYDGRCICSTLRLKPVMQDVNGQMLPVMMFADEEHGHSAETKDATGAGATVRVVAPKLPKVDTYWHEPPADAGAPVLPLYHASTMNLPHEPYFPLTRWALRKLFEWLS